MEATSMPAQNDPTSIWLSLLKRQPDLPTYLRLGFWLRAAKSRQTDFLEKCAADSESLNLLKDTRNAVERLTYDSDLQTPANDVTDARRQRLVKLGISLASAASVVALVGAALMGYTSMRSGAVYSTATGGFERVPLADGSVVELNTNSAIRVRLGPQERIVELLRGEAHFNVGHDATRPFIVQNGSTALRALGTEFDVRSYDAGRVDVLVTEGRVEFRHTMHADGDTSIVSRVMRPGEAVSAAGSTIRESILDADAIALSQAWRRGLVIFSAQPLSQVVTEINRYSERQLVIGDASIAGKTFTGSFKPGGVEVFARSLENYGIRATRDGNTILLKAQQ